VPYFKKSPGQGVSAARGHDVYVEQCAVCHGMHGKGDGPRSAFFVPGGQFIPDLTVSDYLKGRDDQLLQSIREGLKRQEEPAIVMPQFKYILSEDEIRSALAYVKSLSGSTAKAVPVAAGATTATAAKADAGGSRAEVAMTKAGCMACHAKDKKIVGPSFTEIAAKYKGQNVTAQLVEKVRKGGSGVFGPIPMAPNPPDRISDADLKAAIEYILK
jgi:cytochrome c